MPSPVDPSDMNMSASDTASASGSEDPASDTADTTSQNQTASAMNPSRLLRTALFSVLALLFVGAMMPTQAQDSQVFVEEGTGSGDGTTDNPFPTIQAAVNDVESPGSSANASAGDDVEIVVRSGTYDESADRPVNIEDIGNTDALSSLTISNADGATPEHNAGTDNGAYRFTSDASIPITIEGFDIDATISAGASSSNDDLLRTPDSRTAALTFQENDVDLTTSGDFSGSGDAFLLIGGGEFDINDNTFTAGTLFDGNPGGQITGFKGKDGIGNNGGSSVTGNTFEKLTTGVQFADPGGDVTVNNNTFKNVDSAANFIDADGSTNTGDYTVNGNDFGEAGASSVRVGVTFGINSDISTSNAGDDNFTGDLTVKNNNFNNIESAGAAVATVDFDGSGVTGFLTDANDSVIDATENYFGSSDGPTDDVSSDDGRDGGAVITDGRNETIAFVPFYDDVVESGDRALPDNEIFVNRGDAGTGTIGSSTDEFETIDGAIGAALPGETIVVKGRGSGTPYTSTTVSDLGNNDSRVSSLNGLLATVTFAASTDISSDVKVDGLDLNQPFSEGGNSVRLVFDRRNSGLFSVTSNNTLEFSDGLATIASSGALELLDGGSPALLREDGKLSDGNIATASNRVVFDGTPNVKYDASSDIATGRELPQDPEVGTLTISSSSDTRVTSSENITASSLTLNDDATFENDFTVSSQFDIGGNDLSVGGTLSFASDLSPGKLIDIAGGSLNGDVGGSNTLSSAGNVRVDSLDGGSDIIEVGSGSATINNLTAQLDPDQLDEGTDNEHTADLALSDGSASLTVEGKVDALIGDSGSDSDDITFRFEDNDKAGSYTIGGGDDFGTLEDAGDNQTLAAGITFTGDATATTTSSATDGVDTDLNSNKVNIEVKSGSELTLRNEDGGNALRLALGDGSSGDVEGGLTGEGTLRLAGSGNIEVFNEDASGTAAQTIEPGLIADTEVTFDGDGDGKGGKTAEPFELSSITANAPVTFENTDTGVSSELGEGTLNGNTVNSSITVLSGGELQTGDDKFFVDSGSFTVDGGNAVIAAGLDVGLSLDVQGNGTFTVSGGQVTIGTDLTIGSDPSVSLSGAGLTFDLNGAGSEIDLAKPVTVSSLTIDKLAGQATLLEGSDLNVSGNVTVNNPGPDPAVALSLENDLNVGGTFKLQTQSQSASITNKVTGSGAVVLEGGNLNDDGSGEASIQNVATKTSVATVNSDFQFGSVTLNEAGIDVDGADLSPVSDSTASVAVSDASVVSSNGGTFNAEENEYNLTYSGSGSSQSTGLEVGTGETSDDFGLQDFTLAEGATASLSDNAAPRGDVLVDTDATLGGGGGELIITNAASTTFNGTVNAPVRGSGTRTIDGGENGVVASVTASGPNAEFEVLVDEVENTVTAADSASVTMDLSNEQTIGGLEIKGGGEVTLNSEVTNTGNFNIYGTTDSDDNRRRASVLSLGDNNLILEGNVNQGIPSDALPDSVEYRSDGGEIVFDTNGDVASSAQSIPNIAVRDADGSGSAPDPSIPSDDTLSFNESAALEAGFSGSGTLEATGTTITLDASDGDSDPNAVEVPTFTVNSSGSSVTEVIDGGAATDDESFLYATDSLNFETGELEHDARVRAANLNYSGNEFAVTATSGQIELEAAEVKLGGGLTIPVLATVGSDPSNLTANSAGTEEDLTVGDELTLGQRFETDVTDTGDLVIADAEEDVLVTRTNEYPDRDILDEALTFAGDGTTYDLSYEAADNNTSNITSGFEAASGADRIDSLAVDLDEDPDTDDGETLTFESNADFVEGAAVTANGALNLQSGDVDYGQSGLRDLAVSSGASYVRSEDATLDVSNDDGLPIAVEGSGYSITYQAQDGTLEPNVREFPEGREIAGLTVEGGTRDENGNEATSGTVDFTLSRAVSGDLEVDNTSSSDLRLAADTDGDGTLDFEEELDVSGNVVIEGRGTTDGGSVSSLSVGGDVTASGGRVENFNADGALTVSGGTASNADVAGDVSIEQGGSLEGNVTLSGEDSQALSLGADVNQAPLEDLTLAQTTSGESAAQVNLSGGDLDVDGTLTLSGGVLDAESDETVILTNGTFERNVESGEESHVAGRVERTVSDNNLIVFPVGSAGSEYRPFEIALPEGTSRDLTIGHVTEDPGSPGLPTEPDNEGVSIQSTPGYFWTAEANQSLSITESFELAIRGTGLDESNESSFRILSGAEGNDFEQVGDGTQYANSSRVADGVIDIRTVGATSAITDETRRFTIGQPTAETAEGLQIAGQVNYPTVSDGNVVDGRALEGVEVEATSGDVTETATTDADGNFTIGGLDSGDYEVTANVDRDVSNVSIGDAQRTVSGFAGTEPFAGAFQEEVADVNASGTANATDALRIAFFDLGSISSFEAGSFLVDTTEVTLGSESESGVTVRVAEFGDADLSGGSSDSGGDASLATTTVSPKSSAQTAAKSATESAGDANRVAAGETFEVPVRVDRGAEVGSYSLSLEYDTEKATFEGISSGRDDIITNGSKEDGTLQVGWFDRSGESTLELTGGSELVTLRFSAAEGVEGAEFAPEITSGEINGPGAKAVAAGVETQAVRIAKPAPDEFALNGSYPNPASQQATVEMDLPVRAQVTVEVYNTLGQRVQTVEQSMSAGAGQTVQLDASQLASGQYFYRVKASLDGNQTRETGRLTIVK